MKPWLYISNTRVIAIPDQLVVNLDAYERDVEVVGHYVRDEWSPDGGLSRLEAYLLTSDALLVAEFSAPGENQLQPYRLASYPLRHLSQVERNFTVSVNQYAYGYLRVVKLSLEIHFTAASGIASITIPEPKETNAMADYYAFCQLLCQRVG